MRTRWMGAGALAAGLLVVLGFSAGPGSTPSAYAQTCESDEEHCIIITTLASEDGEFSFNDGDIQLGNGESEAINVELDGSLTVTEDETDGWVLEGIDCEDEEFTEVDLEDASVTFDFSDFDDQEDPLTIECVFINAEDEAASAADEDADEGDEADEGDDADTADEGDEADEGDDADQANAADDDEATPTSTATSTSNTATNANATTTPSETPMIILGNTGNPSAAQTPTAPTPRPATSQVQAGSISPPSTGSGGLK